MESVVHIHDDTSNVTDREECDDEEFEVLSESDKSENDEWSVFWWWIKFFDEMFFTNSQSRLTLFIQSYLM